MLHSPLHLGKHALSGEISLASESLLGKEYGQSEGDIEDYAQTDARDEKPAERLASVQTHPIREAKQRVGSEKDRRLVESLGVVHQVRLKRLYVP